jgi:hypothetical protein
MTRPGARGALAPGAARLAIPGLLVLALVLTLVALDRRAPAFANGGQRRLAAAPAGPYVVTVWTQPTPPTMGPIDVSVAVMQPGSLVAVPDADATLTAERADRSLVSSARAVRGAGFLPTIYHADLELPADGLWHVTVKVSGPAGAGTAAFDLHVVKPARIPWLTIAGAGVLLVAALALVLSGSRASRRPGGGARGGRDGSRDPGSNP